MEATFTNHEAAQKIEECMLNCITPLYDINTCETFWHGTICPKAELLGNAIRALFTKERVKPRKLLSKNVSL